MQPLNFKISIFNQTPPHWIYKILSPSVWAIKITNYLKKSQLSFPTGIIRSIYMTGWKRKLGRTMNKFTIIKKRELSQQMSLGVSHKMRNWWTNQSNSLQSNSKIKTHPYMQLQVQDCLANSMILKMKKKTMWIHLKLKRIITSIWPTLRFTSTNRGSVKINIY